VLAYLLGTRISDCPKQTSEVKTRTLKNQGCGTLTHLTLTCCSCARVALLFPGIAVFVVAVALPEAELIMI
jgi:hypothetical protein